MALEKISFLSFILLILVVVGINRERVKVAWTPGDNLVEWFEIRTRWRDKTPQELSPPFRVDGSLAETIIPRPRSGNFAVEVRACREWEEKDQCSIWIKSDLEGTPEPWIIFWKPLKPFGLTIEDNFGGGP